MVELHVGMYDEDMRSAIASSVRLSMIALANALLPCLTEVQPATTSAKLLTVQLCF